MRESVQRASVVVRPLVMAVVGLVGIPAASAFEGTAGLPASADHRVQAGYSTGRILNLAIEVPAVTLKHGPIVSLGMPDMTMNFRVENARHLTGLNVGDRVRFEVRRVKGTLVIFNLESI